MASVDRRSLLGYGVAGAGTLALGATPDAAAAAETEGPVVRYDLSHLYELDLGDPRQAARAYDEVHAVATVQGIVNRASPRLYVRFVTSSELGDIDVDAYWWKELRAPGGLLRDREVRHVDSLDELIATFRPQLHGAVVWDPQVPATSNVASTVAGAQDLVAFRYDPAPDSLYSRYVGTPAPSGLPAVVRLVGVDGSAMFTGRGQIPGTRRSSTGSAKCDAYVWALERYLRPGRSRPELAYYLDAFWLSNPQNKLQQALLSNHDYLVARRGFLLDLLPWDDETPVDDPEQPIGTDQRTLEEILRVAYDQAGEGMVPVHGFVPWSYKYTTYGSAGGNHAPVPTEWRFVQIASAFNAYVDADAENLDAMANASVYTHQPLRRHYPQPDRPGPEDLRRRGLLDTEGRVASKRYVMFYVGDYDSAAWLYQTMPYLWDDPARGSVPLNWAHNPNLASRMPPAFVRARRQATALDTFVAGDSGAGYVNPGMLAEPREFSGLPSGVDAWRSHCLPHFRKWDLGVTGFVIDGFAPPMNEETMQAYAEFSPGGFAAQKVQPLGMVGDTPYVRMGPDLPRGPVGPAATALREALRGDLSGPPETPEFHSVRTILMSPSWHRAVVDQVLADVPDAAVEIVDAHTFYGLVRAHLTGTAA